MRPLRQNPTSALSAFGVALALLCGPTLGAEKASERKQASAKAKKAPVKAGKAPESKKPAKPAAKPTPKSAPAAAPRTQAGSKLEDLDKLCRRDLSWGKLDAVRQRCADLEPRGSAVAVFWRLTLSDDPNDLRKGYAPAALGKGEVDSRLLLSAGRYHFARGQIKEMEDLVEIARKHKIANPEIDTLKRLTAGK